MIEAGVRDSSASMVLARNWTLFYRSLESDFMSVPISSQNGELRTGQPQKKFGWAPGWAPYYDLASDGTRGVAAVNLDGGSAHLPCPSCRTGIGNSSIGCAASRRNNE